MKSGSVTSPNQLTLKARADDMSQPSSGVMKSSAYSRKCETCAARSCQRGAPGGSGGTGLSQRHASRSSARPRMVMPMDLCVARMPIFATGDKPFARRASTNWVMINATIAQWNNCATAPYRFRVFFKCMGMSTAQTAASLSD